MAGDQHDKNKEIEDDILKCKSDILRANDIIPPFAEIPEKEQNSQNLQENRKNPSEPAKLGADEQNNLQNPDFIPIKEVQPSKKPNLSLDNTGLEPENTENTKPQIPTFDLANEIMAEQRRITAVKRMGPGKKTDSRGIKTQFDSNNLIELQPSADPAQKNQVISEIVARDIQSLRRS
jgi:hypothetical protein